ncbi:MAG: hypothetical protein H6699_09175, partial [Myxococcales bacterium]|nr:hypothetical protein [Myxococcales bacterium]
DCDGAADDGDPGAGASCDTGGLGACRAGASSCLDGALACIPRATSTAERCDGVDNDCDGLVDEDEAGAPLARSCYEGDASTLGVGVCVAGVQSCGGGEFGACIGDVTPSVELCDGADNDCDGEEDEDVVDGASTCATGLPGVCALGIASCIGGASSGCVPVVSPSAEVCDGLDNDCDGLVDEDEAGDPLSRACYTGPAGTAGVGECSGGTESCVAGQYSACLGQVTPRFEVCDGLDNDCDGTADDGNPEGGALCDTDGVGACRPGTSSCVGGALVCTPRTTASTEQCDGIDNDCDGAIDENEAGGPLSRACYDGPAGTSGVGVCHGGAQVCMDGDFGSCTGDVVPTIEVCDGLDNDCDGGEDEDVVVSTSVCSTGLSGACAIGVLECVDGGEQCTPVFAPGVEVCDGLDNDCDGLIDETAAGDPLSRACYTGPTGTAGVGECAAGLEVCQTGQYTSCQGQVTPQFETCDGLDNDCDGAPDDGNPGGGALCDTGLQGICAQGVASCVGGAVECTQRFAATTETCDGFDNDCDGVVDEDIAGDPLTRSCYDGPSDTLGVGQCRAGTATCRFGDWGGCAGQIIPLGEVCDFEDNDCDGDTDEGVQLAFFLDADLDGYGDPDTIVMACFGDGYVTNGLDCYDSNPQANPEQAGYFATDRGDGSFDYNCDGDEDGFYTGYGSCQSSPPLCYLAEEGWSSTAAIPDCGVSGTYIFDCLGNGANCNPTTAATVQRCH